MKAKNKFSVKDEMLLIAKDIGRTAKDTAASPAFRKMERDFVDSLKSLATDFKKSVSTMGGLSSTKSLKRRTVRIAKNGKAASIRTAKHIKTKITSKLK